MPWLCERDIPKPLTGSPVMRNLPYFENPGRECSAACRYRRPCENIIDGLYRVCLRARAGGDEQLDAPLFEAALKRPKSMPSTVIPFYCLRKRDDMVLFLYAGVHLDLAYAL